MPFDSLSRGFPERKDDAYLLRQARDLISDPFSWCREYYELEFTNATLHCAVGAIRAVSVENEKRLASLVYDQLPFSYRFSRTLFAKLTAEQKTEYLIIYNDHHARHRDIVRAFDRAIAKASRTVELV